MDPTAEIEAPERTQARRRLEKRRNLYGGVAAFVVINTALVVAWWVTGGGYFWPAWIILAWGGGLVLGLWDYLNGTITDEDVDAELRRMRRRRGVASGS